MNTLRYHVEVQAVLADITTNYRTFHGELIDMHSQRYKVFSLYGTTCVTCNCEGTHFRIERHRPIGKYHLNLYTDNGILMTKDHIIPKSKGGEDTMTNYQPMCTICNSLKGNNL